MRGMTPTADPSPYYLREWWGSALFGCPDCGYTGRTPDAVDRHRGNAHRPEAVASVAERAWRAGIILPGHGQ